MSSCTACSATITAESIGSDGDLVCTTEQGLLGSKANGGFFDDETCRLQGANPFEPQVLPMSPERGLALAIVC